MGAARIARDHKAEVKIIVLQQHQPGAFGFAGGCELHRRPGAEIDMLLATADSTPSSWKKLRGNAGARLWVSRDAGDSWTPLSLSGMRDKGAITDVTTNPAKEGAGLIGTSSGNLYYGGPAHAKWTRIMFGMPTVRSLLLA